MGVVSTAVPEQVRDNLFIMRQHEYAVKEAKVHQPAHGGRKKLLTLGRFCAYTVAASGKEAINADNTEEKHLENQEQL